MDVGLDMTARWPATERRKSGLAPGREHLTVIVTLHGSFCGSGFLFPDKMSLLVDFFDSPWALDHGVELEMEMIVTVY